MVANCHSAFTWYKLQTINLVLRPDYSRHSEIFGSLNRDHRKDQSYASLALVWGIHRWPANSPHKGPVTRKMFPFDETILQLELHVLVAFKYAQITLKANNYLYLLNTIQYTNDKDFIWSHFTSLSNVKPNRVCNKRGSSSMRYVRECHFLYFYTHLKILFRQKNQRTILQPAIMFLWMQVLLKWLILF